MSVEDRLRSGLEANARAFVPEGERRLEEVHGRHRTRTGAVAAVAAAAIVAAVAAGSLLWGLDRDETPEPAQRPGTSYTGQRIPDSTWRKVVTRAQLVRAGADREFIKDNLGRADRLPTTLSFVGEAFSQSGRYPAGWAVGDNGDVDYDRDGLLVLTSTAPGCRGCVVTLTWRIDGDRLVLGGFRGSRADPMAREMLEGAWTRVVGRQPESGPVAVPE